MKRIEVTAGMLLGAIASLAGLREIPEPVTITQDKPVTYVIEQPMAELVPMTKTVVMSIDNESWFGTDQRLTDYEWDIFGQVLMAEARGESYETQYYIACVILNRVNSPLFPDTLAGVIYQTQPAVQFYGAWDPEHYEVTDSAWEAIQAALIHNDLPEDVYYFNSEGYLPNTEPWQHIGNMWFSGQEDI